MRTATILLGGALMVWIPGFALADGCDVSDAACVVDGVSPGIVDEPIDTVVDTLDGTQEVIEPVVVPILDLVDDLLGGGIVDPPGGDGPGAHGSGSGQSVSGRGGAGASEEPSPTAPTAIARESARPLTLIGSAISGTRPEVTNPAPDGLDGLVEGAVRGLLLVVVLFGVTVAFVLLQDRLDRNDPKLTRAPLRAEIVTFR